MKIEPQSDLNANNVENLSWYDAQFSAVCNASTDPSTPYSSLVSSFYYSPTSRLSCLLSALHYLPWFSILWANNWRDLCARYVLVNHAINVLYFFFYPFQSICFYYNATERIIGGAMPSVVETGMTASRFAEWSLCNKQIKSSRSSRKCNKKSCANRPKKNQIGDSHSQKWLSKIVDSYLSANGISAILVTTL